MVKVAEMSPELFRKLVTSWRIFCMIRKPLEVSQNNQLYHFVRIWQRGKRTRSMSLPGAHNRQEEGSEQPSSGTLNPAEKLTHDRI